jgi:AraC-like DNA-binding protein
MLETGLRNHAAGELVIKQTDSIREYYRHGPYRDFAQDHRGGGTFGVSLLEVEQKAIESVDPALSELLLVTSLSTHEPFETNFGDGWRRTSWTGARTIDLQPSHTECNFRLPDIHLRFAAISGAALGSVLDRHDLSLASLSGVTQTFRHLPRAVAALDAMWAAAASTDPAASLDLDGAFLTMLSELIAACGHGLPPAPKLEDRRLARAIDYAETHIAAALTVGELAGAAAMSPSAFSRAFSAATGEMPWAFIRRRRLERAGEQLTRTDDTLMQIAADCGFADASHLARCWKRAHGTTPRSST